MANEEAPRSCRPSSSLNKEEAEALKREIATLSKKVSDMQKERDESKVVYIKKRGLITFEMREAMAENVVAHATSFAKAPGPPAVTARPARARQCQAMRWR